jgi:hypothetical protein
VKEVDWGTVSAIAALVVACFGYLSRQMNRLDDRLSARIDGVEHSLASRIDGVERSLGSRIDQLTERYIAHLERHPH